MKVGKLPLLAGALLLLGIVAAFAPLACRPRAKTATNAGQRSQGAGTGSSFDGPGQGFVTGAPQPAAGEGGKDEKDDEEDEDQNSSVTPSSTPPAPPTPSAPPAGWRGFRSVEKGGGGNCGFCSIGAALGMGQQQARNGIDNVDVLPGGIAKHELARRLAAAKNDFDYGRYYRAMADFDQLKVEIKSAGVHQLDFHSIRLMEAAHKVVAIAVQDMNLDARTYTFNYGCYGAVNNPGHVVLLHGGRGHYTALEHAQTGSNGFATAVGSPAWPIDVQQLVYDCYRMSGNPIPPVIDAKVAAMRACWVKGPICNGKVGKVLCEGVTDGDGKKYCSHTAAQANICRTEYDLCGWYSWTGTQNDCEQGIKLGAKSFCRWSANAHYGNKHCGAAEPAHLHDPCKAHDGNKLNCNAAVATLAFGPNAAGWNDDNRKLCSYRDSPAVCEPRRGNRCTRLTTPGTCNADLQCEWRH